MSENKESTDIVESYVFPNGDVSSIEELASSLLKGDLSLNFALSDEDLFSKIFEEIKSKPGLVKDIYDIAEEKNLDISVSNSLLVSLQRCVNLIGEDTQRFIDKVGTADSNTPVTSTYGDQSFIEILNPVSSYHQLIKLRVDYLREELEKKHEKALKLLENNGLLEKYNEGIKDFKEIKQEIRKIDRALSDASPRERIDFIISMTDKDIRKLSKSEHEDDLFKLSFDEEKYEALKKGIDLLKQLDGQLEEITNKMLKNKNIDTLREAGIEITVKNMEGEDNEDVTELPDKIFENIKDTVLEVLFDKLNGDRIFNKILNIITRGIAETYPYVTIHDNLNTLIDLKDRENVNDPNKNSYKRYLINSDRNNGLIGNCIEDYNKMDSPISMNNMDLFELFSKLEDNILNETEYFKKSIGLKLKLEDEAYSRNLFNDVSIMINLYESVMLDKIYGKGDKIINKLSVYDKIDDNIIALIESPEVEITSRVITEFFNGFTIDIDDPEDLEYMLSILKILHIPDDGKIRSYQEKYKQKLIQLFQEKGNASRKGFRFKIDVKEGQFIFFYEIFEDEKKGNEPFLIKTNSEFRTHQEVKENYNKLLDVAISNGYTAADVNALYDFALINHSFYCNGAEGFD